MSGHDGELSHGSVPPGRVLSQRSTPYAYAWGIGAVVASSAVSQIGGRYLRLADLIMIYLLGVVIVSTRFGVGPSIFTAMVSALSFDFFFIPPAFQFAWPDVKSVITFGVMIVVAAVISTLNDRLRRQETRARVGEARTAALYAMSRELSAVRTMDQLVGVTARHVESMFGGPAAVFLAESDGTLRLPETGDPNHVTPSLEMLAKQAWTRGETVGLDRSLDEGVCVPLIGSHEPVGVLALPHASRSRLRNRDQVELLERFVHQAAIAIERTLRVKEAQRAQVQVETERLRSSLLSAVSHDLKTPLTAIIGAASTLAKRSSALDATGKALLSSVAEEAQRLNGLVTNLLAMTRLESGTVEIQRMEEPIEEIIASALGRLAGRLDGRPLETHVPVEMPLVPMDPILIEQLLINLLENALRYSPPGSPLEIRTSLAKGALKVELLDRGPGIAVDEHDKVFEKFYRGEHVAKGDGGVGLGLTICRAIVRAHGGRIWIQNRTGGGANVQFTLPCSVTSPTELEERVRKALPDEEEEQQRNV